MWHTWMYLVTLYFPYVLQYRATAITTEKEMSSEEETEELLEDRENERIVA